ncbi:MAG: hypothetical protein Q9M36_08440 [Sulfurovum sp.]|nr:hypothetical protein [Sulfurovum sp.]
MTQLQINSPEMQDIFKTKFNSNQDKFMEFILSFLQDNKNIVDKYFEKNKISNKEIAKVVETSQRIEGYEPVSKELELEVEKFMIRHNLEVSA